MKLKLSKPLAFFDIESTNKDPLKARIIELGIVKLHQDGKREEFRMIFNPEENISEENAAIHGFTNESIKDSPLFKQHASMIAIEFDGCDLAGFNSNAYDIPLLSAEFKRAGIDFSFEGVEFVDAGNLFKILAPRTLTAAVLQYLGKNHEGAHGAIADTQATIDVLEAMLISHSDVLPVTVPELALKSNFDRKRLDLAGKFAYNDKGEIIYNFGKKNNGQPVHSDPSYLDWMLSAKDEKGAYSFPEDTRNICVKLKHGQNADTSDRAAVLPKTYNPNNKSYDDGFKSPSSTPQVFRRF